MTIEKEAAMCFEGDNIHLGKIWQQQHKGWEGRNGSTLL